MPPSPFLGNRAILRAVVYQLYCGYTDAGYSYRDGTWGYGRVDVGQRLGGHRTMFPGRVLLGGRLADLPPLSAQEAAEALTAADDEREFR